MAPDLRALTVLSQHRVPFVVIGGHAVNVHGVLRATEDTDVVWLRSQESEGNLLRALVEIDAHYIGNEIDPATGIEHTHPVTASFIRSQPLMMLCTSAGFVDLFDLRGMGRPCWHALAKNALCKRTRRSPSSAAGPPRDTATAPVRVVASRLWMSSGSTRPHPQPRAAASCG